jgi:hypothetical protein
MWYKPRRALRGPGQVVIPIAAANNFPDFEVFGTDILLSYIVLKIILTRSAGRTRHRHIQRRLECQR